MIVHDITCYLECWPYLSSTVMLPGNRLYNNLYFHVYNNTLSTSSMLNTQTDLEYWLLLASLSDPCLSKKALSPACFRLYHAFCTDELHFLSAELAVACMWKGIKLCIILCERIKGANTPYGAARASQCHMRIVAHRHLWSPTHLIRYGTRNRYTCCQLVTVYFQENYILRKEVTVKIQKKDSVH